MARPARSWGLCTLFLAAACASAGKGGGVGGEAGECPMSGMFRCDDGTCIPRAETCDGIDQCPDGSDESTCVNNSCQSSEFQCRDGSCIQRTDMCNGITDCSAGEDEASCSGGGGGGGGGGGTTTCGSDQFTCTSNTPTLCIPMTERCDGRSNCSAGEDEQGCPSTTCTSTQFQCTQDNSCIPRSDMCDGTAQCPGGTDEQGCTGGGGTGCGSVTFQGECTSGGSAVRWCEGNTIHSLTCSSGYACAYDVTNGIYDCEATGGTTASGGCGSVTYAGGCDGDWVYWCQGSGSTAHVEWLNCYPDYCGWQGSYYGCVTAVGGGNSCVYAYDGVCDEPNFCAYGTDSYDCGFF